MVSRAVATSENSSFYFTFPFLSLQEGGGREDLNEMGRKRKCLGSNQTPNIKEPTQSVTSVEKLKPSSACFQTFWGREQLLPRSSKLPSCQVSAGSWGQVAACMCGLLMCLRQDRPPCPCVTLKAPFSQAGNYFAHHTEVPRPC